MNINSVRLAIFVLLVLSISAKTLSCLSKDGVAIPWFFNIKFPYSVTSNDMRFGYLDPNSKSGFDVLESYVNSSSYSLYKTVALINSFSDLSILAFNDETPTGKTSSSNAHAKGVLAYDEASGNGVYIMHSIPNYPNVSADGKINVTLPNTATTYGQNIYCLSFDGESLDDIIHNLGVIHPIIYYQSGVFADANFKLTGINSSVINVQAQNGDQVLFLSKSPSYTQGFLYENIIEPYIDAGLEVESWGRPYQPSECGEYDSLNILTIGFNNGDTWTDTNDHSKWAVSIGGSTQYACSCDINRMTSQAKRGGSCLCSTNAVLNSGLRKIVKTTQSCSSKGLVERFMSYVMHIFVSIVEYFKF